MKALNIDQCRLFFSESATQLDEQTLLPIIALTIKKQYLNPKTSSLIASAL